MPSIGSEPGGILDASWLKHADMEEKRNFSQQCPSLLRSPPALTPLTHLWDHKLGSSFNRSELADIYLKSS